MIFSVCVNAEGNKELTFAHPEFIQMESIECQTCEFSIFQHVCFLYTLSVLM